MLPSLTLLQPLLSCLKNKSPSGTAVERSSSADLVFPMLESLDLGL